MIQSTKLAKEDIKQIKTAGKSVAKKSYTNGIRNLEAGQVNNIDRLEQVIKKQAINKINKKKKDCN